MDNIVAIEVKLQNGARRFFLTWGRVFDPVDPASLIESVGDHMNERALGGKIDTISVCDSLQEARDEPYFFEALFDLCQTTIPFGDDYEEWRARTRERVRSGKELYFLGHRGTSEESP